MQKKLFGAAAATVLLLTGASGTALAAISYDLTVDHCTGGCNPGAPGTSMGTVLLVQNGTNDVRVTVTLVSPLRFVGTGLDANIDFNLAGILTGLTAINFTNAAFFLVSGTAGAHHFNGFGDFGFAIDKTGANGAGGSQPSPLAFDLVATGLTESSFVGNAGGFVFGVDVYNTVNGNTGPVATGDPNGVGPDSVPEPSSVVLLSSLVVGLAMLRKWS